MGKKRKKKGGVKQQPEQDNSSRHGRLISVSAAARRLDVTRARVHQYIDEGRLHVKRDPFSNWFLVDEDELDRLPLGRDWRSKHGIKVGDRVRLTVPPRCEGAVKKILEPDTLVLTALGHGEVHVSAWDVEVERGED